MFLARTFLCAAFAVGLYSCNSEQTSAEALSEELNSKSLNAGPFVKKMNIEGKCPKDGNGCGKSKRTDISPEALGALDFAVDNGADGIKEFFIHGPWSEIFPGLDTFQREIYDEMISGVISATSILKDNKTIYCFGTREVNFDNAKFHFIVE